MSFTLYCCFHSFIYILLNLLSHTFLLSHVAIDPQSESPISQLTVHPLHPRDQKAYSDALGPHVPLAFWATGPT
jgi:hypothetical protein